MTAKELQKRNEKSQHLRVVQVDDETFYVESSAKAKSATGFRLRVRNRSAPAVITLGASRRILRFGASISSRFTTASRMARFITGRFWNGSNPNWMSASSSRSKTRISSSMQDCWISGTRRVSRRLKLTLFSFRGAAPGGGTTCDRGRPVGRRCVDAPFSTQIDLGELGTSL